MILKEKTIFLNFSEITWFWFFKTISIEWYLGIAFICDIPDLSNLYSSEKKKFYYLNITRTVLQCHISLNLFQCKFVRIWAITHEFNRNHIWPKVANFTWEFYKFSAGGIKTYSNNTNLWQKKLLLRNYVSCNIPWLDCWVEVIDFSSLCSNTTRASSTVTRSSPKIRLSPKNHQNFVQTWSENFSKGVT